MFMSPLAKIILAKDIVHHFSKKCRNLTKLSPCLKFSFELTNWENDLNCKALK